jgi:hypothetical protein
VGSNGEREEWGTGEEECSGDIGEVGRRTESAKEKLFCDEAIKLKFISEEDLSLV